MIVNIRGTNGSGKSTLVRSVMDGRNAYPIQGDDHKVLGYSCGGPGASSIHVVGRYETACGGCDTIKTQDEVVRRVRNSAATGAHVLFEGVVVGTIYGRYKDLALSYPTGQFVVAFLDTPLETCFQRIADRREAAGNPEPWGFNREQVEAKYNTILRQREKFAADGVRVVVLPWTRALKPLLELYADAERSL